MEVRDFASSVDEIKANQQEDEARAPGDNKNSLKDGFYLHGWENPFAPGCYHKRGQE
jgi:hypothetical protein